ncbi:hypothetical protein BGZ61DRAFT_356240 [Ilyonectria robusta]|uniref:uncharacterized protein n=1 Tax=Ilyonectria robusta TaxID=1079257 RepID=UPI001E8D28D5|nr:uncharacterized protein BGZ61DRAFT_356240 [Ilyonectria robusta]KAH8685066.1 hypothetical protein BGZ61DRAFT_356240 [Ilyonectria robusta]
MGGKKHVTSACLNCRRRKIKCDGKETCSNCIVSKHTCTYNAEADLRKASAKKAASKLRAQLALLQETLREHNIQLPSDPPAASGKSPVAHNPTSPELEQEVDSGMSEGSSTFADIDQPDQNVVEARPDTAMSERILPSHEQSTIPTRLTPGLELPDMDSSTICGLHHHTFDTAILSLDMDQSFHEFMLPPIPRFQSPRFSEPSPNFESEIDDSEAESDITKFLAARVGSLRIAEDGQLRYYGPTSNLHAHQSDFRSLSQSTIRHVATEGCEVLKRLGLDYDVPPSLEEQLARLYFAWEDPAIHVIDEDTFFMEKRQWTAGQRDSPYYSETLNNAICAIGAILSAGEQLNVPEPAPEFFSARAKTLLDIEMDSPTVATVQALVVMSALEASFTRDARGWLYSDKMLTYISMWSLYVGRPWSFGVPNITTPRPMSHLDGLKSKMWRPYPKAAGQSIIPEDGIFFPLEACTDANITLCEFMRRINLNLYSGHVMSIDRLVQFLKLTKDELMSWHKTIPTSLQVDPSRADIIYVPAVLQLHQLVCYNEIFSSTEDQAHILEADSGCISAAHGITELLRCYQRQHSLRRSNIQIVHIIFTASLVFIYDVCSRSYSESRTSLSDLQFCCHTLGEIGQSYGNATRALEVIILVKSEWQRLAAVRSSYKLGKKRPSFSGGHYDLNESDNRQKRRGVFPSLSVMDLPETPGFVMDSSLRHFQMLGENAIQSTLNAASLGGENDVNSRPLLIPWHTNPAMTGSFPATHPCPMSKFKDRPLNPVTKEALLPSCGYASLSEVSTSSVTNENAYGDQQHILCQLPKCIPDLAQPDLSQNNTAQDVSSFLREPDLDFRDLSWDNGFLDDVHLLHAPGQDLGPLGPTQTEDCVNQGSKTPETSKSTTSPGAETLFSSFSFIAHLDLEVKNIKGSDLNSLESQGCLSVPIKPILDELLQHYFLHIHPMLPLLDEGEFWESYDGESVESNLDGKPQFSLLLLRAMLFASCTFLSQESISSLGFTSIREVKKSFYGKAKLLYDLGIESDPLSIAQAALLLTYWCPASSRGPKSPNSVWLSIAIKHAQAIDADQYATMAQDLGTLSPQDEQRQNQLKRIWWCCIIRDRIMPLCVRRNTQITQSHFDFRSNPALGYEDLSREIGRSRVYTAETKRSLVIILARMTELCVCLTDILDLVYPIRDLPLSDDNLSLQKLARTQEQKANLKKWFTATMKTLDSFTDVDSASHPETSSHKDAVVLHTNLVWMYYHSARIALCNYEFHFAVLSNTTKLHSPWEHIMSVERTRDELLDASKSITSCLKQLLTRRLACWLPSSAVGCTALPLALYMLDVKLSSTSAKSGHTFRVAESQSRLNLLIQAMKEYHPRYEGADWVSKTIRYFMECTYLDQSHTTCSLSIIDTTCSLTVPADTLVEPVIRGHELMNFPTFAFLITHSVLGKQILFDLGCRKDFWNLPPPISEVIDAKVPGIRVDKNLVDILTDGGIDVDNIDAAIISHHHYDHIGDPSTFPRTMALLVGPGFSDEFLPGYPTTKSSPLFEKSFQGRRISEITFSDDLTVAGFRAHDYFSDGSLYILDSPGHAIGHLSALVRTTKDTFVFLGGDICHFGGAFRPTEYVPMPPVLSSSDIGQQSHHIPTYICSTFTDCHPDRDNARTMPYYKPCTRADSWYVDPPLALQSIEKLADLDASDRVLVLIAHDPSIINALPIFPTGDLNNWYTSGWKQKLRWRFLNELPIRGRPAKYLVDGTYMDGMLVKDLNGVKVERTHEI